MKSKFMYAALASIATLTACSMNEIAEVSVPSGEVPISFAPMASKQTKATPIDGTELKTGNKMLILKSYLTNERDFDDPVTKPYKWIDGTLAYTTPEWTTPNTYYWPSNETFKLSFFSYYPAVNGADGTTPIAFKDPEGYISNAIVYPSFSFTVPTKVADQKDLIAASKINLKRTTTGGATAPDRVPLQYKHLLSQVRFTAQAAEPNNYSVRITKLGIKGAQNTGTFVYDGTDAVGEWTKTGIINTAPGALTHIYRDGAGMNPITKKATVAPTGDVADVFMLMPQSTDKDFIIYVEYTIYDPTGKTEFIKDVPKTARMEKLERGKKYAYNLVLPKDESLKPIEFTVDVTDWDAEQNHDVKFTPYAFVDLAKDPAGAAGADAWDNNAKWIAKHIAEFATEYVDPTNLGGHTAKSAYTHTIELNGAITNDVTIDLSAVDFSNVEVGSKIILDATAIAKWTATKKITVTLPAAGWDKTADLTSAGKITLTKK